MSTHSEAESFTYHLAQAIIDFEFSQIPQPVLEQTKHCVIDNMACALGGRQTEMGQNLLRFARQLGGAADASLLGEKTKISVIHATWANSSLSNLLDMDDTFAGFAHIGNAVIATALAVGEWVGASGQDLLTAVVAGYEIAARIGLAIWPSPEIDRLYGIQPTWKVFGAVAAAAKLFGMNKDQIVQAFGLAGTCAPLPMTRLKGDLFPRGWYKNGHGWGAFAGIFWTLLAREGFLGAHTVLDGDGGFWRIAGSDRCDFAVMTEGLGTKFHILDIEFKPYPACRWAHSTIDGFRSILREKGLGVDDIETIRVSCLKGKELSSAHPQDMMDAQFSIPHILAMVALGKPANVEWMLPENLAEPAAQIVAEKVTVETDTEAEKLFMESRGRVLLSKVQVTTRDGQVLERHVLYPKGTPREAPMTERDLRDKFETLAAGIMPRDEDRQSFLGHVTHLENLDRISELTAALARQ